MEWIFRFPVYIVLDELNPDKKILQKLPKLNNLLIPAILQYLEKERPEVEVLFVDPVDLQSDYLQNYYLFPYDIDKTDYYPCGTTDSYDLSSKLKLRLK